MSSCWLLKGLGGSGQCVGSPWGLDFSSWCGYRSGPATGETRPCNWERRESRGQLLWSLRPVAEGIHLCMFIYVYIFH